MSRFKGSPYRRQDLEVGDSRSGGFDGDDDAGETSSGPFDIDSTKNIPIARLRRWRVCLLLLLLLLLLLSLSLCLSVRCLVAEEKVEKWMCIRFLKHGLPFCGIFGHGVSLVF